MRVQLAQTTGWYSEGGQSTWGFGVEVDHFGSIDLDSNVTPEGWQVMVLLGPWMLAIFNEAGFQAIHGDSAEYYGTFSVQRP